MGRALTAASLIACSCQTCMGCLALCRCTVGTVLTIISRSRIMDARHAREQVFITEGGPLGAIAALPKCACTHVTHTHAPRAVR